ncbi:MAG: sugar phosphate isomerase/epimerase [Gemmatimonadaceae bacterium]|nr:sugar phosphate isomerase/epimerase [Gemmatimonadaceae bacterium]
MTIQRPARDESSATLPRREFIQAAALGLLGAGALPLVSCAKPAPARGADSAADPEPPRPGATAAVPAAGIALQLYTVRDAIKADLAGTLRRVKSIGFDHVETAFWPEGVTLTQAAQALRDAGLTAVASHIEIPQGANRQAMLDTAKAYGSTHMIWHGWPEDRRYSTLEGTKELARIYNESSVIAKDNGLTFGVHNHWWEYRNTVGGRHPYEVLLEELSPDVFFEVDTYWVKVAGHVPAAVVAKLGARAQFLHIKDGPAVYHDNLAADNPDPMSPVGSGTQDFPAIVKAAAGNTKWMVVEMDKVSGDVFSALDQSYRYLTSNKLVRVGSPTA